MDDFFSHFLQKFGPAFDRREAPISSIERYADKLPSQLLEYWTDHGWCGYADGLFWTVNPQEYEPVLDAWLSNTKFATTDTYHVIARNAFGDLYLWGEQSGNSLHISSIISHCTARTSRFTGEKSDLGIKVFFSSMKVEYNDYDNFFGPALKRLGRLTHDEIYGFVPALALGGPRKLEHLEKVSAVEHLVFLAQLSELKEWDFPDI